MMAFIGVLISGGILAKEICFCLFALSAAFPPSPPPTQYLLRHQNEDNKSYNNRAHTTVKNA